MLATRGAGCRTRVHTAFTAKTNAVASKRYSAKAFWAEGLHLVHNGQCEAVSLLALWNDAAQDSSVEIESQRTAHALKSHVLFPPVRSPRPGQGNSIRDEEQALFGIVPLQAVT